MRISGLRGARSDIPSAITLQHAGTAEMSASFDPAAVAAVDPHPSAYPTALTSP
jgi:hypothetical protein